MYKIYITYPSVDRYKWLFSFPGTMSKKGIVYNVAHQLRSKNSEYGQKHPISWRAG